METMVATTVRYKTQFSSAHMPPLSQPSPCWLPADHVKFNFVASWALAVLAWQVIEFGDGFRAAGQMSEALDNLRWGADYMMRCHVSENIIIAQVGNGGADHRIWTRAEDITTPYPVYTVSPQAPGADMAGTMAAALAAVSIVFKSLDPNYSHACLTHARSIYK
jgi:hypothetical protein